jgi:hypothetical protein
VSRSVCLYPLYVDEDCSMRSYSVKKGVGMMLVGWSIAYLLHMPLNSWGLEYVMGLVGLLQGMFLLVAWAFDSRCLCPDCLAKKVVFFFSVFSIVLNPSSNALCPTSDFPFNDIKIHPVLTAWWTSPKTEVKNLYIPRTQHWSLSWKLSIME